MKKLLKTQPTILITIGLALVTGAVMQFVIHANPADTKQIVLSILGAGGVLRAISPVSSPATVEKKVAEGQVLLAEKLNADEAGPPGTVTPTAATHIADIVTTLLGTPAPEATSTVDQVLGARPRRGPRSPL